MKFEYENKERDDECVAYIDIDGDLIVKRDQSAFLIHSDISGSDDSWPWSPETDATHKFYPGDKITITF
jgi:hypothetical protein